MLEIFFDFFLDQVDVLVNPLLGTTHDQRSLFFRTAFDIYKAIGFTLLVRAAGYDFSHPSYISRTVNHPGQ